jgi:hypothetical protein
MVTPPWVRQVFCCDLFSRDKKVDDPVAVEKIHHKITMDFYLQLFNDMCNSIDTDISEELQTSHEMTYMEYKDKKSGISFRRGDSHCVLEFVSCFVEQQFDEFKIHPTNYHFRSSYASATLTQYTLSKTPIIHLIKNRFYGDVCNKSVIRSGHHIFIASIGAFIDINPDSKETHLHFQITLSSIPCKNLVPVVPVVPVPDVVPVVPDVPVVPVVPDVPVDPVPDVPKRNRHKNRRQKKALARTLAAQLVDEDPC